MKTVVRTLLLALACGVPCTPFAMHAQAQCPPHWIANNAIPGLNSDAHTSIIWDPDGTGPQPNVLVVGGQFLLAGTVLANGIATWNPVTKQWAALGSGFGADGSGDAMKVTALCAMPNGDLIAGGNFGTADGSPANHIARWNGTQWLPMGGGMTGVQYPIVTSLAIMPNGDLVAGGDFALADGIAANDIARWNGSTWSPLIGPSARQVYSVSALAVLPDGKLAASSGFPNSITGSVDIWDGTDWNNISSSVGSAQALNVLPTGELIAAGNFTVFAGINCNGAAIWNGSNWSALGSGPANLVNTILFEPGGTMIACGASRIRRWNGSIWSDLNTQYPSRAINTATLLPDGSIFVGGQFLQIGSQAASHIARLELGIWHTFKQGLDGDVNAIATLPNGDMILGGHMSHTQGADAAARITRWNGVEFSPLGIGLSSASTSTNSWIAAVAVHPSGEIIAGGLFAKSGIVPISNIAQWNGSTWNPLGSGLSGTGLGYSGAVETLLVLPNGDIVAGGDFSHAGTTLVNNIARWDGTQWLPFGQGLTGTNSAYAGVQALLALPNGDLIAGGAFTRSGTLALVHIARWNGTAWVRLLGNMTEDVRTLALLPDGSFIANGASNGIGRWTAAAWSRLSGTFDGSIYSLKLLSNGNLVAAGQFTRVNLIPANGIAQWNGTSWSPLGSGINTTDPAYYPRFIRTLAESPNGILNVGGHFEIAGPVVSPYLASYAFNPTAPSITQQPASLSTCPAATAVFSITATGTGPFRYYWQYEYPADTWYDLDEGNNTDVGFVTGIHTSSITITNLGPAAASRYRVVISNFCGTEISNPAALTFCFADFNCDNLVDFSDYLDFVSAFADNDPATDFNHDSTIDLFDYLDFVQGFSTGC